MIAWLLLRFLTPHHRRVLGAVLLDVSLVGWPVTALTVAKDEPQYILGLSWLAISFTALDLLFTTDVRTEIND